MIRKFNYTDRIKIRRADLRVSIVMDGGVPYLEADFVVDPYRELIAPDAAVYIEAYHRTKFERFSYGTIGRLLPPEDRRLRAFASGDREDIRFRVKVVDESASHGRILGLAEGISAVSEDERHANRLSLLGVDAVDLANRIWELDLEAPEIPWLKVNSKIADVQVLLRSNDMFLSSVYPEIVRQILVHVLIDCEEDYTDFEPDVDDELPEWQYRWLCFGKHLCGEKWPKRSEGDFGGKEWIELCVDHFCRNQRVLQKVSGILGVE